jgi:hypothetical protein
MPAVAPTPAEVEELAVKYHDLETQLVAIAAKAKDDMTPLAAERDLLWEKLVAQTRQFGSAHAEKSKLLYGLKFEVMATFGSTNAIDAAAVEEFRLALVKAKQARLLKRVFEKSTRWTLLATAGTFLLEEFAHGKIPAKLFALFARCSVPKDLTPKLVVRPKAGVV